MTKASILNVQGKEIALTTINDTDYISLTDMIKSEEGEDHIRNWMRNKIPLNFLVFGRHWTTQILKVSNSTLFWTKRTRPILEREAPLIKSELPHPHRCHQEHDPSKTQHQPDETGSRLCKRSRSSEHGSIRLYSQTVAGSKPGTCQDNEHPRHGHNQPADCPFKHRIPQCGTYQAGCDQRRQIHYSTSHCRRATSSSDIQKRRTELCKASIRGTKTHKIVIFIIHTLRNYFSR